MNCPFCGAKPLSIRQKKLFSNQFENLFSSSISKDVPLFNCDLENLEALAHSIKKILWTYYNEDIVCIAKSVHICESVVISSLLMIVESKQTFEFIVSDNYLVNSKLDFLDILPREFKKMRLNAFFQMVDEVDGVDSYTLRDLLDGCDMDILEFRDILKAIYNIEIKNKFFPLDEPIENDLFNFLTSSCDWLDYKETKKYLNDDLNWLDV